MKEIYYSPVKFEKQAECNAFMHCSGSSGRSLKELHPDQQ